MTTDDKGELDAKSIVVATIFNRLVLSRGPEGNVMAEMPISTDCSREVSQAISNTMIQLTRMAVYGSARVPACVMDGSM